MKVCIDMYVPSSWCPGWVARMHTSARKWRPGEPAAEYPPAAWPAGCSFQTKEIEINSPAAEYSPAAWLKGCSSQTKRSRNQQSRSWMSIGSLLSFQPLNNTLSSHAPLFIMFKKTSSDTLCMLALQVYFYNSTRMEEFLRHFLCVHPPPTHPFHCITYWLLYYTFILFCTNVNWSRGIEPTIEYNQRALPAYCTWVPMMWVAQ